MIQNEFDWWFGPLVSAQAHIDIPRLRAISCNPDPLAERACWNPFNVRAPTYHLGNIPSVESDISPGNSMRKPRSSTTGYSSPFNIPRVWHAMMEKTSLGAQDVLFKGRVHGPSVKNYHNRETKGFPTHIWAKDQTKNRTPGRPQNVRIRWQYNVLGEEERRDRDL